jgi:Fungal protein of unknown function (DUF1748)
MAVAFVQAVHVALSPILLLLPPQCFASGNPQRRDRLTTHASPSFNSDKISNSKEVKGWVDKYLGVGEWVMDQSIAVLGSSGYFERRR